MEFIKPGKFTHNLLHHNYYVCADSMRDAFDESNATLLRLNKKPKFIFIGDSLIAAYDLNNYFGDTSFCINRGIGGDVPMYIYRRFEADVIQLCPEYCLLLAGVNEVWCLDNMFESEQEFQIRYETAKGYILNYIKKIINTCIKNNQRLILCSVLPTYGRVKNFNKDANDLIIDCNRNIKQMADENELIFVDCHSHLCDNDGKNLKRELSRDGVHLKPEGYDIISNVLKETLWENGIVI